MEEKTRPEQQENPIPLWIKIMYAVFVAWALFYLSTYWFPDLSRWMQSTNPDATQWQGHQK
ncbi:MAG: hypothetical protein OEV28_12570 [Nitrospirota bacterium]|nr:hypothetical protein [Nitrospirota bacterium]